jgi:hypothetical protein
VNQQDSVLGYLSRSKSSDNLTAKWYGPFVIQELVRKNAVRLEFPDQLKMHPVVRVIHTTPYRSQPPDIAMILPEKQAPVPAVFGDEHEVEANIGSLSTRSRLSISHITREYGESRC